MGLLSLFMASGSDDLGELSDSTCVKIIVRIATVYTFRSCDQ